MRQYRAIFVLFLALASYGVRAQDGILYRHKIMSNPFLYTTSQANLAYQYRINKFHSAEISAGKLFASNITGQFFGDGSGSHIGDTSEALFIMPTRGTILRAAYKYYIPFPNRKQNAPEFYISPLYQYKQLKFDNIQFGGGPFHDGDLTHLPMGSYDETRNVHGVSFMIGAEQNLKRVLFDFYAGAGYKYLFRKIQYDNYLGMIRTGVGQKCPCELQKHMGGALVFHLGVKIGYQFKPIVE